MPPNETEKQSRIEEGARILTETCARIRPQDQALIISDSSTEVVGSLLSDAASNLTDTVTWQRAETGDVHGGEPDSETAALMQESDIILAATQSSLAHSHARFQATESGARYLSLPDYDTEQLARPSLRADFPECARDARRVAELFETGEIVQIQTARGTDLQADIRGRSANFCPGICSVPGSMGSPPDIETNVAPRETASEGTVVVDGSIPCQQLGLVDEPLTLDVADGRIQEIAGAGPEPDILRGLFEAQDDPSVMTVAEIGLGLNPKAELCGRMLEDEGCRGTIHLGVGSNETIGGENEADFHLDLVMRAPTIQVDERTMMRDGELVI